MTGLSWLRQVRSTPRSLRAAVSLLLAIVLVAGGASFPPAHAAVEPASIAIVVESQGRVPGDCHGVTGERVRSVRAIADQPDARPKARWLDLRSGGLPAARAPDVAATPRA